MKSLLVAMGIMFMIVTGTSAAEPIYIDTDGRLLASLGEKCQPQTVLPDGRVMVFQNNERDFKRWTRSLADQGIEDIEATNPIILAQTYDCERKSSKECSSGTCKSGSCQYTSMGNSSYCRCR